MPEEDVFKGKISDYGLPAGSMLLLTTLDGTVVDSLYPAENGSFTMRKVDKSQVYRLTSADQNFKNSSVLKVYDRTNDERASTPLGESNAFKFGPLELKNINETIVKNKDVLKFTLSGVLTKPVGVPGIEKLTLLDADGNFLSEGYTTQDNDFSFSGLAPANKFIIQTGVEDAYASITARRSINADTAVSPIQGDGSFIIDFRRKKPGAAESDEPESVLSAGSTFDLPSVFYDFNSYRLLTKSKESLDLLVELLIDLPAVRIEIQSHTDSRGPKGYNQALSQKRAESVVTYLVSKGINLSRLQSKGFGEDRLSNKCADEVRCTEAEHALNRRTTFVIL
jgi:outer membrane protein OmpA-like peptidoglycan-associated protein